jgi:hypothetical protein
LIIGAKLAEIRKPEDQHMFKTGFGMRYALYYAENKDKPGNF